MQLSRYGSLLSIITLLTISIPAQAFCSTEVLQKLELTPSLAIPIKPTPYEQKATSAPLQENNCSALESNESKTKPLSTRYLDNEIQRTKPLPRKYQAYGENIQLLNYQQQVRNAQTRKNAQ